MQKSLEELISFGKEFCFSTCESGVLLPLEQHESYEWGVIAGEGLPHVYVKQQGNDLKIGDVIECFTPDIVLKTVHVNESEIVLKKKVQQNMHLSSKGLIQAFLYKDSGSIDSSFINLVYQQIFPLLPDKIKKVFFESKFGELFEKLEELDGLQKILSAQDYDNAKNNIAQEMQVYVVSDIEFVAKNSTKKTLQQIYKTLITKGMITDARDLFDWSRIKPNFSNKVVQQYYKTLITQGQIDYARDLFNWTKIQPDFSNEVVQQGYKTLITQGDIYGAWWLFNWSGIKPDFSNKVVQQGYKTLMTKGWIDTACDLFGWSKIKPDNQ